nr:hypothetical protein [Tanacetum cinerariifolium]
EALLAAQRKQELREQEQAAQEKEEPPQNSDFHQLIEELYCMHNDVEDLIESSLKSKLLSINLKSQRLNKEKQEVKNTVEQAPERRTRLTKFLESFKVIHKKSSMSLNNTSQISSVIAITPVLPTKEPEYSLSMGDEHLSTILKMELDEVIKSSVKNLVPIPSESEVTSDNESKCDVPVCNDFMTFSNPLFDSDNDFTSSDDESLSNEDFLESFKVIHKKSSMSLNNTSQISSVIAITPVLPTKEPEYSLSMGDEHLSTILKMELDEVIKSSVKNLVPIPSESEVTSDNESKCDVPVCDDFMTFSNPLFDSDNDFTSSDEESLSNEDVPIENFKIYSNSLFDDEESISTKIDPHYFNAESNLLESLLNRDTLIDSSHKFDFFLEEFSGELAHIDPIPPRIEEADFNLEEEIRLVENLFYDNSSPRPPEELNAEIADTIVESFSPSPIPVEDSDSLMEEIHLFLDTDELKPPGIESDDYNSEGDIQFLEELLSNDTPPLPENKSSNFDHHDDPLFSRPPPEPPDVEIFFDFEHDTGVLTTKVVKGISKHYGLMPNILSTLSILYLVFDPLLSFSSKNEDKVFKPGILSYLLVSYWDEIIFDFSENPMMMYGGDIPQLVVPALQTFPMNK